MITTGPSRSYVAWIRPILRLSWARVQESLVHFLSAEATTYATDFKYPSLYKDSIINAITIK